MNPKKLINVDSIQDYLNELDLYYLGKRGYSQPSDISSVVLLFHVHCLPSVYYLFSNLVKECGFRPENIYFIPKLYSTIEDTADGLEKLGINIFRSITDFVPGNYDQFAQRRIQKSCDIVSDKIHELKSANKKPRLILVDDGGILTTTWVQHKRISLDYKLVSVQQTASGMYVHASRGHFPKIDVARSAAKKFYESNIIAAGIVRKIMALGDLDIHKRVCVVGFGAIGKAITRELLDKGHKLNVVDIVIDDLAMSEFGENNIKYFEFDNVTEALDEAEIVFGCVGRNWMQKHMIEHSNTPKKLYSCSSRDIEFKEVIKDAEKEMLCSGQKFRQIKVKYKVEHIVENSGFPINFDRENEWETTYEISITRALMLLGILQATCMPIRHHRYDSPIKLDPFFQRNIVKSWLSNFGSSEYNTKLNNLEDVGWFEENSGGVTKQL